MSFLSSYTCPQCNNPFPFFIRPSLRINRGLRAPYLKCSNCGQVYRQRIDLRRAAWIWPLTIIFFVIVVYIFKIMLYQKVPILYIILVAASLFPVFIGIRKGQKLVKVADYNIKRNGSIKWFLPLVGIAVFTFLWGYYSHNWLNVVIGITVGLIVWAFFYYSSGNKV